VQRLLKDYKDEITDTFKCLSWLKLVEPRSDSGFGYMATPKLFELLVTKMESSCEVSGIEKWISLMSNEVFNKEVESAEQSCLQSAYVSRSCRA
jgi:hypothetical protein